jgi:hypothetical protein
MNSKRRFNVDSTFCACWQHNLGPHVDIQTKTKNKKKKQKKTKKKKTTTKKKKKKINK